MASKHTDPAVAGEWTSTKARQMFIDFFEKKHGHTFWPSSPTVPHDDPTLLFANAGMNQYKSLFLGTADPNTDFGKMKRAVNSQKCIRAGGKHNDLEDVGRDTYHHTFFEMLGNWSFGDFFKKEAIPWAWELLTSKEYYGLEKDRLYVTYFEGDEKQGLKPDEESREIWKSLGVPDSHIIKGNMKDNFWEMGDTGPCGPCSEIHYDRIGGGRNAADLVNMDDPMVLEVWNLVFMQFDRQKDRSLKTLPKGCVDTGMGLERLVSVLNHKSGNYETDLWNTIFEGIQKVTKYDKPHDPTNNDDANVAYRVVADHARCLVVSLVDGATPDSVGRGFVLRRIIRRAIRFGVQFLGAEFGFFTQLVDYVVASLGDFFTELKDEKKIGRCRALLKDEEDSFKKTWKTGLKHFETARDNSKKEKSTVVKGEDAFVLHDRYGFPVDLTVLMAEKEGMTVDVKTFEKVMKDSQTASSRVSAAKTYFETYQVDELQKKEIAITEDKAKYVWEEAKGKIVAVFDKAAGQFVDKAEKPEGKANEEGFALVLDKTNFYYESGGQIYDTGVITIGAATFEVRKVLSFGGYIAHIGFVSNGTFTVGEEANLEVDYKRRQPIAVNHTLTHQLNHALRIVLEDQKPDSHQEVNQKGSLVTEEMLRFDFSYNSKLSEAEIKAVEAEIAKTVAEKRKIYSRLVSLNDAKNIYSVRMMFGEKYPDPVTLVSIGADIDEVLADPKNEKWRNYSLEFCGGTHIKTLEEAEDVVVVSEDALMKGVRRLVVYTREQARKVRELGNQMADERQKTLDDKAMNFETKQKALSVLNKKIGDSTIPLVQKIQLRDTIDKDIKKLIADAKAAMLAKKGEATEQGKKIGAELDAAAKFHVFSTEEFGAERDLLQALNDGILAGANRPLGVLVLGVDTEKDKAMAIATVPKEYVDKKVTAVDWAKLSCGKGGGKPNAAQSGLPASKAADAVAAAKKVADEMSAKL